MRDVNLLSDTELESLKTTLFDILSDETLSKNEARQYQEMLQMVYQELKNRKGAK